MERRRAVLCHLGLTLVGLCLTLGSPKPTNTHLSRRPSASIGDFIVFSTTRSTITTTTTTTPIRAAATTIRTATTTTTTTPSPTPIPTIRPTSTLTLTSTPTLPTTPTSTPTPPTTHTPTPTSTPNPASNSAPTTDPSITDAPTSSDESVAPPVAGDRSAVDWNVNRDVWIAVTASAACLILLTIILVVVCVRRRKCVQKPTPSTGSTGHRDTGAENVYTVNGDTSHEIVLMPLTTIQLELPDSVTPNPDPEVSAPGPGTSVHYQELPHWEPDTTPEVLDGGASGGQAREPDVYAVVRRDRQEDDDLNVKENAAYGQLL